MYTREYVATNYKPNRRYPMNNNGDRFIAPFWAPFVVGGLAGTALGYGIANNNQMTRPPMYYGQPMPYYPPVYQTYYYY